MRYVVFFDSLYINVFVEIRTCAFELDLLISPARCSDLVHIQ